MVLGDDGIGYSDGYHSSSPDHILLKVRIQERDGEAQTREKRSSDMMISQCICGLLHPRLTVLRFSDK